MLDIYTSQLETFNGDTLHKLKNTEDMKYFLRWN